MAAYHEYLSELNDWQRFKNENVNNESYEKHEDCRSTYRKYCLSHVNAYEGESVTAEKENSLSVQFYSKFNHK